MAIVKRYAHINHVANATQDLLDAASAKISGSMLVGTNVADSKLELTGSLYVSKNAVIKEHLTGTLGALFLDTIKVDQQADMVDVFPQVTDTSDLGSEAKRWDNLFAKTVKAEVLSSSVDADFNGTLHVAGDSTFEAGDVTVTAGDVFVTLGDVSVAAGKIEATVGDIIALAGTVSASVHIYAGQDLEVANSRVVISSGADLTIKNSSGQVQFSVDGDTGNTTVNGDTTVNGTMHINGDVIVDGQAFTLDSVSLLIEDKNIVLANVTGSGGSTDNTASGGGITISGSSNKTITWYRPSATGDTDPAPYDYEGFYVNQSWMPQADVTFDLGKSTDRWKEVHARTGSFNHLAVIEESVFGGLATFNGGGTVPSGQTFTIESGATLQVNGTANYLNISATGDIVAAGALTGSALRIHGVDLSPISASLYTEAAENKTLFTVAIASGEMIKLEMEVIAHGDENTAGSNLADAASFKYSVSAIHTTYGIEIKATEIAKEAFAQGVNLDIDITENGSSFTIAAKGASGMPKANWSAQIVKRMQMSGIGVVLELRN